MSRPSSVAARLICGGTEFAIRSTELDARPASEEGGDGLRVALPAASRVIATRNGVNNASSSMLASSRARTTTRRRRKQCVAGVRSQRRCWCAATPPKDGRRVRSTTLPRSRDNQNSARWFRFLSTDWRTTSVARDSLERTFAVTYVV